MSDDRHDLMYDLLPRILRIGDKESGHSLRALLEVLDVPRHELQRDLAQLADDWFIETCSDDMVAYLGDLVDAAPGATRGEVANRLLARRRPGTLETLVQVVRDVSGCAVEGTEVAPDATGLARVELSIFLTDAVPLVNAQARRRSPGCFTIHPLGVDERLVKDPGVLEPGDEPYVPVPLRLTSDSALVARHVRLRADGEAIPPAALAVTDLGDWAQPANPEEVFVDPVLGRVTFAARGEPHLMHVDCALGSQRDLGGGPYQRPHRHTGAITDVATTPATDAVPTLSETLDQWSSEPPTDRTIRITDSSIHSLTNTDRPRRLTIASGTTLTLTAANSERPCVLGNIDVSCVGPGSGRLVLDGLIVEGTIEVAGPVELALRHCTARSREPDAGDPTIVLVDGLPASSVVVDHSILGPIVAKSPNCRITVVDSIIDASDSVAIAGDSREELPDSVHVDIHHSTVIGSVNAPSAGITDSQLNDPSRETPAETRFGHPRFVSPNPSLLEDALRDGLVGVHANNPVLRRIGRLREQLDDYLPLDVEAVVTLM